MSHPAGSAEVNPYAAPLVRVEPVEFDHVEVLRRDRIGFCPLEQIYRFASLRSVEQQLDLAEEFFLARGCEIQTRHQHEITFTRATRGFMRFVTSRETGMKQTIALNVRSSDDFLRQAGDRSPARDVSEAQGSCCEIHYTLLRFFEFFLPPHHLEIEVRELAALNADR